MSDSAAKLVLMVPSLAQFLFANSAHPVPGTGPYHPPVIVDPGETDPGGGQDIGHPVPPGEIGEPIDVEGDLLHPLYPGGTIGNFRPTPGLSLHPLLRVVNLRRLHPSQIAILNMALHAIRPVR